MTVDIEGAHTSEDEGSLASIRERIKQSRVFSGHPAELAGPIGGDEEEEPEGKHVQPPADEPVGGGSLEEEGGKGGEATKPPKYKSAEAAEKAAKEAERKMHEATTRAAELERENEELRTKQAQPAQETPQAPTPEEMEGKVAEVLNEIDNLDPYAEDYATQRAKLWTQVATLRGESSTPDESKVTEIVRRTLDEENRQRQSKDADANSRSAATQMAKEAGLDMADESYDSLLFWKALESAPMHEGVTLKEQVDHMVSQVKAKKGKVAAARSETAPESEILERGGTPRPRTGDGDHKPRTMGSIRERLREKRTL